MNPYDVKCIERFKGHFIIIVGIYGKNSNGDLILDSRCTGSSKLIDILNKKWQLVELKMSGAKSGFQGNPPNIIGIGFYQPKTL